MAHIKCLKHGKRKDRCPDCKRARKQFGKPPKPSMTYQQYMDSGSSFHPFSPEFIQWTPPIIELSKPDAIPQLYELYASHGQAQLYASHGQAQLYGIGGRGLPPRSRINMNQRTIECMPGTERSKTYSWEMWSNCQPAGPHQCFYSIHMHGCTICGAIPGEAHDEPQCEIVVDQGVQHEMISPPHTATDTPELDSSIEWRSYMAEGVMWACKIDKSRVWDHCRLKTYVLRNGNASSPQDVDKIIQNWMQSATLARRAESRVARYPLDPRRSAGSDSYTAQVWSQSSILAEDSNPSIQYTWHGWRHPTEPMPLEFQAMPEASLTNADYQALIGGGAPPGNQPLQCTLTWVNKKLPTSLTQAQQLATIHGPSQEPTEEDTLLKYIRHSKEGKFTNQPCSQCGASELYWAHEIPDGAVYTEQSDDYCRRCKTGGAYVLVDAVQTPTGKYRPHACSAAAKPSDNSEGDPTDTVDDGTPDPWEGQGGSGGGQGGASQGQTQGSPNDMPEPPWKQEGADPSQQPQQGDGDDETQSQEDDEPWVRKDVWFGARCSDGDWLKEYTDRKAGELMGLVSTAVASNGNGSHVDATTIARKVHSMLVKKIDQDIKDAMESVSGGTMVTQIEITGPDKPNRPLPDVAHKQLPDVITLADARLHVLMVGGAGTGKGHMAEQVAEALELDYYELPASLNPQSTVTSIMGYMTADGTYVPTMFRRAVEHGGVMFLDELDNAHPAALAAINGILAKKAGRKVAFPDKMIPVHENFVVVAAANTYGRGPNQTYAARMRGDAATWDRFNILDIEIDEALEMTLSHRTGASARTVAEVLRFVRTIRKRAEELHKPIVLGQRASIDMCTMLKKGMDPYKVVSARCRRGMSDSDWRQLVENVRDMELDEITVDSALVEMDEEDEAAIRDMNEAIDAIEEAEAAPA